jgi:hypothetical protein
MFTFYVFKYVFTFYVFKYVFTFYVFKYVFTFYFIYFLCSLLYSLSFYCISIKIYLLDLGISNLPIN